MIVHGYTESGMIRATIDTGETFVPDVMGNRHRQMIAEWEAEGNTIPPYDPPAASTADVNRERDRRVFAGTTVVLTGYGPVPLQGRDQDQTNLLGLVTAASLRIAAGDSVTTTKFRDAANVDHDLTPSQIIEMWSKGSGWISAVYQASWAIKAMDPIPADFADDTRWP